MRPLILFTMLLVSNYASATTCRPPTADEVSLNPVELALAEAMKAPVTKAFDIESVRKKKNFVVMRGTKNNECREMYFRAMETRSEFVYLTKCDSERILLFETLAVYYR